MPLLHEQLKLPDSGRFGKERLARLVEFTKGNPRQDPAQWIRQRRELMLVHSFLYYHADASVMSDTDWSGFASDLTILQYSFPEHCRIGFYDDAFVDWEGTTGFDLPVDDWVLSESRRWYPIYTGTRLEYTPRE